MAGDPGQRELCITFRVRGERVAVPASDIQKVTPVGQLSRLPRVPPMVQGIAHHRGRVITAIDLGAVLFPALPPTPSGPEARLLLLERGARHLALVVDVVDEIEPLRLSPDLPAGPQPCLRVAQRRGGAILALEVERLVAQLAADFGEG